MRCFFVSDLHGEASKYAALFRVATAERPDAVLLGGDLLRHGHGAGAEAFLRDELIEPARRLAGSGTKLFVIMGNDDPRVHERALLEADAGGVLSYVPERAVRLGDLYIAGYPYVPPSPFQLKDWERYDVSRFVDPGCVSPEEGRRSVPADPDAVRRETIRDDLERLAALSPPERTVYLFHVPPYRTKLDRAALDGVSYDHAPLDVHIGSIAVREFIEKRSPFLTLHGHVHESPRLAGAWRDIVGRTCAFSAAHDGPELALVRFDTEKLDGATRELHPTG
ncbi:MAG: metallophosphoesterase [Methanobacteriota archaeon]